MLDSGPLQVSLQAACQRYRQLRISANTRIREFVANLSESVRAFASTLAPVSVTV